MPDMVSNKHTYGAGGAVWRSDTAKSKTGQAYLRNYPICVGSSFRFVCFRLLQCFSSSGMANTSTCRLSTANGRNCKCAELPLCINEIHENDLESQTIQREESAIQLCHLPCPSQGYLLRRLWHPQTLRSIQRLPRECCSCD